MKKFLTFFVLICAIYVHAQDQKTDNLKGVFYNLPHSVRVKIDSLQKDLRRKNLPDTARVFTLCRIGIEYFTFNGDSSMSYMQKGKHLAEKIKFKKGEGQSLALIGNLYYETSNYTLALHTHLKALKILQEINDKNGIARTYNTLGLICQDQRDFGKGLYYYNKARAIFEELDSREFLLINLINIGDNFEEMNRLDSALAVQTSAFELARKLNDKKNMGTISLNQGNVYYRYGNYDAALGFYRSSIPYTEESGDRQDLAEAYYGISLIFDKKHLMDSSIFYAKESLLLAQEISDLKRAWDAAMHLGFLYGNLGNRDSANKYYKIARNADDALNNAEILQRIATLTVNEEMRQEALAESVYPTRGTIVNNQSANSQSVIGNKYGLFIATNKYDDSISWKNLFNPILDATSLKRQLENHYGFQVELLANPTRRQILEKIQEYRDKRIFNDNDQLVLFMAGHGYYDERSNEGYLIPRDSRHSETDMDDFYISFSRLARDIRQIKNKHILVLMDVCHGGAFGERLITRGENPGIYDPAKKEEMIRRCLERKSRLYITSGKSNQRVLDGRPGENSPFMRRIIDALQSIEVINQSFITYSQLISKIEQLGTSQPMYGRLEDSDSDDFILEYIPKHNAKKQEHLKPGNESTKSKN